MNRKLIDTLKKTWLGDDRTRLAKYLSQPLQLEEKGPSYLLNRLLAVACLFIVGFIVWASVTEVRETAIAPGQIQTDERVTVVQHLEGGIIADILVKEGDHVKQGAPLMRIAGEAATADLGTLEARRVSLILETERLQAFVDHRMPDFGAGRSHPQLVMVQSAILAQQNATRESKRAVAVSRISQREREVKTLKGRRKNLEAQLAIAEQSVKINRDMVDRGLISRLSYLQSEQAYTKAKGDIEETDGQIKLAEEALAGARDSLKELDDSLSNQAIEELGAKRKELAQVSEAIKQASDKTRRLLVTAPESGIVKGLIARTRGSVVAPGEVLMEIVPESSKMVAEVKISPKDIGHVRVGQDARVRISAYHAARFGSIAGKVTRVSASTFRDDRGEPYYKAIVAFDQHHVGAHDRYPILPGMVVDADVITGWKTLSTYMLLPIYRSMEHSFTER